MRREEGAELLFLLLVDRSDQNGHDGYIRADNKESGSDADSSREIALSLPLKDLPDIGQVHLDAVLVLVCLEVHIAELAGPLQFANRYTPKRHNSGCSVSTEYSLSRSIGRGPRGVSYCLQVDNAQPSR